MLMQFAISHNEINKSIWCAPEIETSDRTLAQVRLLSGILNRGSLHKYLDNIYTLK